MTTEIKVYKIWIEDKPEELYIGSTKEKRLCYRMRSHRAKVKQGKESKLYKTIRENNGEFKYGLIASCMVSCFDEQRAFEQEWIDKLKPSLNSNRASGHKIYTKEELKEKRKIKQENSTKICECGCEILSGPKYIEIHKKSKWHKVYN